MIKPANRYQNDPKPLNIPDIKLIPITNKNNIPTHVRLTHATELRSRYDTSLTILYLLNVMPLFTVFIYGILD